MKRKKTLIISIFLIIVIGLIVFYLEFRNTDNNTYTIKLEIVDEYSPDRKIMLYKNNEEKIEFLEMYYLDDVLLCTGKNPTVSKSDMKDIEKVKVKLLNKKIVTASIEKK